MGRTKGSGDFSMIPQSSAFPYEALCAKPTKDGLYTLGQVDIISFPDVQKGVRVSSPDQFHAGLRVVKVVWNHSIQCAYHNTDFSSAVSAFVLFHGQANTDARYVMEPLHISNPFSWAKDILMVEGKKIWSANRATYYTTYPRALVSSVDSDEHWDSFTGDVQQMIVAMYKGKYPQFNDKDLCYNPMEDRKRPRDDSDSD
jgi:hypothetical protein